MSNSRLSTLIGIAPHLIGGVALIVAAGYAGLWLGAKEPSSHAANERTGRATKESSTPNVVHQDPEAPRHFYEYLGWDR